jgi:excisionase family DNA binding protein
MQLRGGVVTVTADAVFELTRPDAKTRQASSVLEQALEQTISSHLSAVLVIDGKRIEVPEAVLHALLRTVHEQAAGRRVRVVAPDADGELTPDQAAAYLGISRPLLVKLLDDGTIPARHLPGSRHRRIAVKDLEAYQNDKSRRRGRLATAMNDIAEADLYLPQR